MILLIELDDCLMKKDPSKEEVKNLSKMLSDLIFNVKPTKIIVSISDRYTIDQIEVLKEASLILSNKKSLEYIFSLGRDVRSDYLVVSNDERSDICTRSEGLTDHKVNIYIKRNDMNLNIFG